MTPTAQKRLAIGIALAVVALFIAANMHFLTVALQSQPDCREAAGFAPAKRAC